MAGRPRTRARLREPQEAIDAEVMAPIHASDDRSMRVPFSKPRHEELISAPMYTMRDLVEMARRETGANIKTLVSIRDDEDITPMVRVAATGLLLDRGFGRAHQSIAIADLTTPGKLDLSAFSADELRDFERLLTKATADKPAPRDVTPPKASRGVVPETD